MSTEREQVRREVLLRTPAAIDQVLCNYIGLGDDKYCQLTLIEYRSHDAHVLSFCPASPPDNNGQRPPILRRGIGESPLRSTAAKAMHSESQISAPILAVVQETRRYKHSIQMPLNSRMFVLLIPLELLEPSSVVFHTEPEMRGRRTGPSSDWRFIAGKTRSFGSGDWPRSFVQ